MSECGRNVRRVSLNMQSAGPNVTVLRRGSDGHDCDTSIYQANGQQPVIRRNRETARQVWYRDHLTCICLIACAGGIATRILLDPLDQIQASFALVVPLPE